MTRISLCVIARDEEDVLERCLSSVRGVVDEICVLDTGSRDATVGIARSFGARVAESAWGEDFGAARNACMELASGDWILVLDADEELVDQDAREKLLAFAQRGDGACGRLEIQSPTPDGDGIGFATRFFPNDGRHTYRGRVHEQLLVDGRAPLALAVGVQVKHSGYSADSMTRKEKVARNLRLLRLALEETPEDGYLWYQLGRTLMLDGQHEESLLAFDRALASLPEGAAYEAALFEAVGYAMRALGHSSTALPLLVDAAAKYPDRPDTCFLAALLSMDTGDLAAAEAGFRRCLDLAGVVPPGGASSPSASTYAPAHNLAVMYEVMGRSAEARSHYEMALNYHPDHEPSLRGLERLSAAAA